jgi:hypothetical protein
LNTILDNPWVQGLITSIVGGLILYFILQRIFRRRVKEKVREDYIYSIERANSEILSNIIDMIAEKKIPEKKIVEATIRATANEYKIEEEDLYTYNTLMDAIFYEIMNDKFLSATEKIERTEDLMKEVKKQEKIVTKIKEIPFEKISDYKIKIESSRLISVILSIIAIVVGFLISYLFFERTSPTTITTGLDYTIFYIILSFLIFILIAFLFPLKRKSESEKEEDKAEKKDIVKNENSIKGGDGK